MKSSFVLVAILLIAFQCLNIDQDSCKEYCSLPLVGPQRCSYTVSSWGRLHATVHATARQGLHATCQRCKLASGACVPGIAPTQPHTDCNRSGQLILISKAEYQDSHINLHGYNGISCPPPPVVLKEAPRRGQRQSHGTNSE